MPLLRTSAVLTALVALFVPPRLAAQSSSTFMAGTGLAVPAGVFAAYADVGFDFTAGWEHRFGRHPFALRFDLSYARNTDTTGIGFHETTESLNAMANLVYHFQGARPRLYALVGVGDFSRRFTSEDPEDPAISDSQLGFQLGEGLTFTIKSASLFVEGRFVSAFGQQPLRYFPVIVGLRFGGPRE